MFGGKKFVQATGVPNYTAAPRYNGEGSAAFIFDREFSNPTYSFRGRARVAGSLSVFQPAQVYYSQAIPTVGLGGLQAGQLYGQPLVSMEPVSS